MALLRNYVSTTASSVYMYFSEKEITDFLPLRNSLISNIWYFLLQSKLIRVLNLWQKNNVFTSAIVQPLLDLVADSNNPKTVARGKARN